MQLGYTHDAFISFSFKDQKVVEHIVNQLLSQYGTSIGFALATYELDNIMTT